MRHVAAGLFWLLIVSTTAFAQQADATANTVERLGTAGILVVAAYFLLRYFMAELAKKDARLVEITGWFLAATKDQATATREQSMTLRDFSASIARLTEAVDGLEERRSTRRDP